MIAHVSPFQAPNSLIDLPVNGLFGQSTTWAETPIVAEVAAAQRYRAIDVWAGESGVDANFLYPMAESGFQKEIVRIIKKSVFAPIPRGCGRIGRWHIG